MTPLPTVWSQLATYATTGRSSRRAAARYGMTLCGCTLATTSAAQSARIVSRSRRGTCRRGLKNHRCIARSTRAERGSHPSRDESSIQFGWPGCMRSAWKPWRRFSRIASG